MRLIEFICTFAVLGSALIWVVFGIECLVSLFVKYPNKVMRDILFVFAVLIAVPGIVIIIADGHYGSFWWWLLGLISLLVPSANAAIIDDLLKNKRCEKCNSWGMFRKNLKEASYVIDAVTTSSTHETKKYRVTTRTTTIKGVKPAKVFREVNQCHCKKCDSYFEWWAIGGNKELREISEDRYKQTKYLEKRSNITPGFESRTKNSVRESYIILPEEEQA